MSNSPTEYLAYLISFSKEIGRNVESAVSKELQSTRAQQTGSGDATGQNPENEKHTNKRTANMSQNPVNK